jgi:hypothetical protein
MPHFSHKNRDNKLCRLEISHLDELTSLQCPRKKLKIFISLTEQIAAAMSHLPKKIKGITTTSLSENFFFLLSYLLSANQALYMSKGISYI